MTYCASRLPYEYNYKRMKSLANKFDAFSKLDQNLYFIQVINGFANQDDFSDLAIWK